MVMKRYANVKIKKVLNQEDNSYLTYCESCGCMFDRRIASECQICKNKK